VGETAWAVRSKVRAALVDLVFAEKAAAELSAADDATRGAGAAPRTSPRATR
jgi:hypothetical protein